MSDVIKHQTPNIKHPTSNKMPTYKNIHNHFRLNGCHFTKDDLCTLAYEFVKEGNESEKYLGLFILDWFDESHEIILKTSGTTGKPKEITVVKQAMVNSALATGDFFGLHPKDKALCCLPVNFVAGKMMLVRAFILGLDIDFTEANAAPLKNLDKEYDFVAMTPMQTENSLDKLHLIRKLIIGGSKINHSLEEKLKKIPSEIYETYASTETLTHIAVRKIGEEFFRLLPGISISLDPRGCLIINAPRISADKIITNDLVELKSENEFILLGRIDDVVNSGGIKLFPEKIEPQLADKIPYRFFLGGISDSVLGEKLVLIIESEKYDFDITAFDTLDKYEKPKEIFFVPKFPETENGKIKKNEVLDNL